MADSNAVVLSKINQIAEKQDKAAEKVSHLTAKVLDPETGIFAKFKINDIHTLRNREDIDDIHDSIENLLRVCTSHEASVSAMEGWLKNHEERDNELRDSVKTLVESVTQKFENQENLMNQKFKNNETELAPLKNDLLIRNANKQWRDKLLWIVLSVIIVTMFIQPAIKLLQGESEEKPKVEVQDNSPKVDIQD